jgi:hypothetical protein
MPNKHASTPQTANTVQAGDTELPLTQPHSGEAAWLAYSYWEERGYQGGSADEDWYRAEDELKRRSESARNGHRTDDATGLAEGHR